MKPLQNRIKDAVKQSGVMQSIIEKDYAISYILAGMASVPELSMTLIFKGGTALKKLYFGSYRFSEDLDFSTREAPTGSELEDCLKNALNKSLTMLSSYGPFRAELIRYLERDPHPGGQEAFIIHVKYPWHPEPLCKIKIEITHDELILFDPITLPVIHGYEEELNISVKCYRLEEIIMEKMRSLLQTHQKLITRGWTRNRGRDYYDLWRLMKEFNKKLDINRFPELLMKKCEHRQVSYQNPEDFFKPELLSETRANWEKTLKPFINNNPSYDIVITELKDMLKLLFPV